VSAANANSVPIRSFLFAPANRLDLVKKFLRLKVDCFVVALEDGTPEPEKESGRETALEGVRFLRDKGVESLIFIRTNSPASKHHRENLRSAVVDGVDGVVIPKLGVVEEVEDAERVLASREGSIGVSGLRIIVGIETALGVQNAIQLAAASDRICAVYFGAEDFAADMGARRTTEGFEVLYARSRVVLGARLAGVTAIDQAVTEIRDDERFRQDARRGKDLGYSGKICVHPRQAELANEIFSPSQDEVEHSRRLIEAYEDALRKGVGTIDFEGQMIDGPLLKRAQAVLAAARLGER
jgi:citrate lyase subunit beta / citryl-CoA lyase